MRSYSYTENFKKFKGIQYDKDGSFMWSIYMDCDDTKGREVYIVTKEEILCYKAYVSKKALQQQKQERQKKQQQSQKGQQTKKQEPDGTKLAKAALDFAADIILDKTMRDDIDTQRRLFASSLAFVT